MQKYKKSQKLDWLTGWKASGLSTKKFAEGKPFSPSSLNYWNRKLALNPDPGYSGVTIIILLEASA